MSEVVGAIHRYRRELLQAGFQEPVRRPNPTGQVWRFYREETELTAFVVNLQEREEGVGVIYGYASTAFTRMAGDETALIDWGVDDTGINLREGLEIRDDSQEEARGCVQKMYERYLRVEKDALLEFVKEKRKAFIQLIAVRLKGMGFLKKGNGWRKALEKNGVLTFDAQKSAYADEYYFNIHISREGGHPLGCYSVRKAPVVNGIPDYTLDWQLYPWPRFEAFLDEVVLPCLREIIHTPPDELGRREWVWRECYCKREHCADCWVEKNHWAYEDRRADDETDYFVDCDYRGDCAAGQKKDGR